MSRSYPEEMDGVIRYRLRFRQVATFAWFPLVPLAQSLAYGQPVHAAVIVSLVCSGWVLVLWRRFGIELRPDALVLYGLRTRVFPWPEIGALYESKLMGQRMLNIYVPGQGRPWMLRAPVHTAVLSPDPEFDAKAWTVMRSWEAHRGPQWTPPAWPVPVAGWPAT